VTTYSYSELETLWDDAGGSKALAPLMAAIAMAESGGNSDAKNPSGATGVWQILGAVNPADQDKLTDPAVNAKEAVLKYNSQGLTAWTTYTSGAYKKYYSSDTPASSLPQGGSSSSSASDTSVLGGLLSIPSQITGFFDDADKFVSSLLWLTEPSSWVRIGAFIAGVALLLVALHALIAVGEGENLMPSAPPIPVPI
jgi:hypothetical protein